MELMALDADKGLREDSISGGELHCSKAIQGKVAVRAKQVMAHAGLH